MKQQLYQASLCSSFMCSILTEQDILSSTNLETTTGQDIFLADSHFSSNNLCYDNLVPCCTDGAAAMMCKNKGFNSRLKEKFPECFIFQCMLHRQALASENLSEDLSDTLTTVVKVLSFIKAPLQTSDSMPSCVKMKRIKHCYYTQR